MIICANREEKHRRRAGVSRRSCRPPAAPHTDAARSYDNYLKFFEGGDHVFPQKQKKEAEVTRSRPARTWSLCGAAVHAHVRRRDAPRDALALTERAAAGALACADLRPRTRRLNLPPPYPWTLRVVYAFRLD